MTTLTPRQNLFVQVLISISLALIVIVGFTWIRFYGVEDVADEEDQASYHTHDINVIKEHRKPYVGIIRTPSKPCALPLASRINRIEIHDTSVVRSISTTATPPTSGKTSCILRWLSWRR